MQRIIITRKRNKGLLKLDTKPLTRILSFVQDEKNKMEAGGVIMGRFIKDSKNVIIDKVTVPMIGDKRSRFSFIRGEKMHQRIITSTWIKSGGTCNYLGEWHTHPESYPKPSQIDIRNWKEILRNRTFSSQYLYFVIVGINEVGIWEGDKREQKIKRIF